MSDMEGKIKDFKEFLNNYNDPNFRSLFEEFTSTAKSPEEKTIFTKEMRRLQRENVRDTGDNLQIETKQKKYKDVEYFHGFCVQTSATIYRDYGTVSKPIFVNICQSDQIKPAVSKKIVLTAKAIPINIKRNCPKISKMSLISGRFLILLP